MVFPEPCKEPKRWQGDHPLALPRISFEVRSSHGLSFSFWPPYCKEHVPFPFLTGDALSRLRNRRRRSSSRTCSRLAGCLLALTGLPFA